jgi:hypothetical protein
MEAEEEKSMKKEDYADRRRKRLGKDQKRRKFFGRN